MDKRFINLVEEVNSYSINDIKDKIRTKIYKEIEKLRKDDDQFSKDLEMLEKDFWYRLLENKYCNLKDIVNLYNSLNSLKYGMDHFTDSVNIISVNTN